MDVEKRAREALEQPRSEEPPCCAVWSEEHGFYMQDQCMCGNSDDKAYVSDWIARENSVSRVAALVREAVAEENNICAEDLECSAKGIAFRAVGLVATLLLFMGALA